MDYLDVFKQSEHDFQNILALAGMLEYAASIFLLCNTKSYGLGSRVDSHLVDISAKAGYALVGAIRTHPHAQASEYYQVFFSTLAYFATGHYSHSEQFDREYGQTPAKSSLIGSSWVLSYFLLRIFH